MTPAAFHGTTLIELVVLPAFEREHITLDEDITSCAYDLIADILHWCEDQGGDPESAWHSGWNHYEHESGEGDDLANDNDLAERANELRARHGLPTKEVT